MDIEELTLAASLDLTEMALPWIAILLSISAALILKEWLISFVKGLKFKLNREFNPGDVVLLDGEPAVIINIGMTKTVFERTHEGETIWRYVSNDRLDFLKLEKIIVTTPSKS